LLRAGGPDASLRAQGLQSVGWIFCTDGQIGRGRNRVADMDRLMAAMESDEAAEP
jgi:hypothetical protein